MLQCMHGEGGAVPLPCRRRLLVVGSLGLAAGPFEEEPAMRLLSFKFPGLGRGEAPPLLFNFRSKAPVAALCNRMQVHAFTCPHALMFNHIARIVACSMHAWVCGYMPLLILGSRVCGRAHLHLQLCEA